MIGKLSPLAVSIGAAWLIVFAGDLGAVRQQAGRKPAAAEAPRPAPPTSPKDVREILALSRQGDWALLCANRFGALWLAVGGQLKPLTVPRPRLAVTFFQGRNTLIYAHAAAAALSGTLAVFDINTAEHREVASLSDRPDEVAASPDNEYVAYVSGRERLQVVDLRTQKVTDIGAAWRLIPSWSPDGKYIVYEKNRERDQGWGFSEVAIAEPSSGKITVLDKGRFPAWSPKGDLIAYTDVDGKQLKLIDPSGMHHRLLKRNLASVMGPLAGPLVWSPDSAQLIYYRVHETLSGETRSATYLINIGSGNVRRLANDQDVLAWR